MCKLRDLLQVVDDARHDRACFIVIKVRKGQRLNMMEKIPSHIPLNTHPQYMPPIANNVGQNTFENVNARKHNCPNNQQTQVFIGNVIIHDRSCNHRVKHIAHRDEEGTDQVK